MSRPQVGETVPERRMDFISVAFLNRENTKKRRISRNYRLTDSTEKILSRRYPKCNFFAFFRVLLFPSRLRDSIEYAPSCPSGSDSRTT